MPTLKSIFRGEALIRPDLDSPRKKQRTVESPTICTVCTDRVSKIDQTTLPCGHKFHAACCQDSLQASMRCPNCTQAPYLANPWKLKKSDRVFMPVIIQVNGEEGTKERLVVSPPPS